MAITPPEKQPPSPLLLTLLATPSPTPKRPPRKEPEEIYTTTITWNGKIYKVSSATVDVEENREALLELLEKTKPSAKEFSLTVSTFPFPRVSLLEPNKEPRSVKIANDFANSFFSSPPVRCRLFPEETPTPSKQGRQSLPNEGDNIRIYLDPELDVVLP